MPQLLTPTQSALRQVKWTALVEIINRSVSPITMVILARLLAPEAFGLVATAGICISFAQMFWDAGLSKAVIQTRESPESAANVVFWTNAVLGIVIYLLLFFGAPVISIFFKAPMATPVIRVIGIQIIITSLSSVQRALFVRELKFKTLFWIQISTALVPPCFSIPMALTGHGVWALVIGTLAGQVASLLLLWKFSSWKPSFTFDLKIAATLFSFGIWVQAESLGAWLMMYGDSIIVGRTLGMEDLGVYRTGWMMLSILFGIVLNPVLNLILPTFSRLQNDNVAFLRTFNTTTKAIMAIALPMGVGLFFCGQDIAEVFFGTKWRGLGFVLQIIGLGQAISWLTGINADAYRAVGKPQINTFLIFGQLFVYLPVYFISSQYGLNNFVISRTLLTCIALIVNVYVCHRILNIGISYFFNAGNSLLVAAGFMALSLHSLTTLLQIELFMKIPMIHLGIKIIAGAVSFIAALYLFDRRFLFNTMTHIKGTFV